MMTAGQTQDLAAALLDGDAIGALTVLNVSGTLSDAEAARLALELSWCPEHEQDLNDCPPPCQP